MSFRLKKTLCNHCGEEGSLECSICREHFCKKHCGVYWREEGSGAHYCLLSLTMCLHCRRTLAQLDPGELLARIGIRRVDIRYA